MGGRRRNDNVSQLLVIGAYDERRISMVFEWGDYATAAFTI